ncbi:Acetylornithine/succinyldiaminopimelate aminotransferase [Desulfovibrio sp. X2]|uniref:aspartate aminotransferase family protein n=1 Tax=Desulfovibrio sp. X2 TaxID=941449 RepID=UPI000358F32C|nr:aspartate aminotransferase family protein [Desulfovibrio sp. X2]EPR42403.1 Acetylornithine/succinyldiaminopimelate aminotransferase [Desulfovibrio sp. X2]
MKTSFDELKTCELSAVCHTYGRYPLDIARGSGSRLYDMAGKEYIDLLSGIAVTSLGHCHPEITQVICEQAGKLVHVSNLFYQQEQVALAERILGTCHSDKVFFCNSGAEANEAAIKLARRYHRTVRGTKAYEVITLAGSFHGRTLATLTATGQQKVKDGFDPLPDGFVTVPWNDLAALEEAMGEMTAAVLLEVILGEGGVRPLPPEYLRGVQKLCQERGVLFMVDEVQTGLCRTGSFWAFQEYGLTPDVFTSAKALANGLPMGAMLATDEAARAFKPGSHATTFGGGALLSRVADKVIEIMERDGLAERAREMGEYAKELFRGVSAAVPGAITDVRGRGLIIGIELAKPGKEVWEHLLDKGFILNLTQDKVLRLLPPLTIERSDLDLFAQALSDVLKAS